VARAPAFAACYVPGVDDRLRELLSVAFRTVPAREANSAISRARAEAAEAGAAHARPLRDDEEAAPLSRSYEIVLADDATFARFAGETLPRLVYHLDSVGARPPACKGVLLAIFEGDRLHLLRAGDALAAAAKIAGTSLDELFRRHGTGESRTAQRGPPPALPPPKR
jgi:hypothetical protein